MIPRGVISVFLLGLLYHNAHARGVEYEFPTEYGVTVVAMKNIDQAIIHNERILIDFYTPWCHHCAILEPDLIELNKLLKSRGYNIKVAKVDVTKDDNKELINRFRPEGYPTMILFQNGSATQYPHIRSRRPVDMLNWIEKKSGSTFVEVKDARDALKQINMYSAAALGLFKDLNSKEAKAFKKLARTNDEVPYFITSAEDVFDELDVKESNKLILFKKYDELRNVYEGEYNVKDMEEFINWHTIPIMNTFNSESAPKLFGKDSPINNYLMIFASEKDRNFAAIMEIMTYCALDFRRKVYFVYVNCDDPQFEGMRAHSGVKSEDCPKYMFVTLTNEGKSADKYLPPSQSWEVDDIKQFTNDVLDGNREKHYLSEDTPEDWDSEDVKILTGGNFDSVAKNKENSAFVFFYAPWCQHCQALQPFWEHLGEIYSGRDDIIIAKIDATRNEIPGFLVTGYPRLMFFPKGSDEVVDYKEERSMDGLTKFLEEKGIPKTLNEIEAEPDEDEAEVKDEL
ncbi:unnamed protein product [Owenia fusiformis]|uniref:protein disulfide-isomerase n=1 Tax=Owenia fusiformis TaxID=6347 RepID=A0A8S4Q960_OWEFU|nr:unnamed protein product [Owenia fusiformis]